MLLLPHYPMLLLLLLLAELPNATVYHALPEAPLPRTSLLPPR